MTPINEFLIKKYLAATAAYIIRISSATQLSLIRLDNKHISVNQLQMAKDRILQCHFCNLPDHLSPLIETYLRETDFWHVALIGRGCKLNSKFISVLVERWRPKMHTFHLLCGECTITLEDMHLQLGLPVDGSVVTGPIQFGD
ncbi:hypothetical protein J1N35_025872 [Gossypium stocksii]|uniref:Aminotransferase-like plant mobile domain-containing protein n=1 Tax=Gossypium stocksii TaxID=47602 RepID=A0A9D3V722_9ROSI|nr:hypothetical protein J1N35_025872 [Gossypium stocksii]